MIEVLDWYKSNGIKSIDRAIKQTEKNSWSYVFPQNTISFKGNSVINDAVHTKLRVTDSDINLTGMDKITYSPRFNEVTFNYVGGEKIKKRGDKAMFQFIELTPYDLFNLMTF